ncbi:MAG: hypothetical protein C0524_13910 [Rhodobacter sp.]|nr:hypothetical protein [Rhodobacter sp.]
MIGRTEVVGVALGDVMAEMAVRIWEPANSTRSALCLHGFAGTGQDFEMLAETLAQTGVTVIAPDMIGRGKSSFLGRDSAYSLRAYMACISVAAQFQKAEAAQLGTSWGGLILLAWLAATGWRSRGLVLNDVPLQSGPVVQGFRTALKEEALRAFPSFDAAAAHVIASRRMGFLDPAAQRRFAESRVMEIGGQWRMAYDPAVAAEYGMDVAFSMLRPLSQAPVPVLMAYGAESPYAADPDLPALAAANPRLQLLMGLDDPHPPSLMKLGQILQVAGWFGQCFAPPRG